MFGGHEFRGVGQGEHELNARWHHHPRAAVPACVVHHQHQQTNVCWVEPRFEQCQGGTERFDIDGIEAQQIAAPGVWMHETIDVGPLEAVVMQGGGHGPPLGPAATQHAFGAQARFLGRTDAVHDACPLRPETTVRQAEPARPPSRFRRASGFFFEGVLLG